MPSDEKLTQGSVARSKNAGRAGRGTRADRELRLVAARLQVAPPLVDTTLVSPLAPPSFQRSCWTEPIRCCGFVGIDGDVRLDLRVGVVDAAQRGLLGDQRGARRVPAERIVRGPDHRTSGQRGGQRGGRAGDKTMAAPRGGASHLTNGSLMLDRIMLMTSSSPQPVPTRQTARRRCAKLYA